MYDKTSNHDNHAAQYNVFIVIPKELWKITYVGFQINTNRTCPAMVHQPFQCIDTLLWSPNQSSSQNKIYNVKFLWNSSINKIVFFLILIKTWFIDIE